MFVGTILLLLIIIVSGLANKKTVRVGIVHPSECNPSTLPLLVAQKRGILQQEGVEIQTSLYTGYPVKTPKMRDPTDQFDVLENRFDVLEIGRGHYYVRESWSPGKFKVFSASYLDLENPSYAILVSKTSMFSNLSQLKGRKIGTNEKSGYLRKVFVEKILAKNGIDPLSVEVMDSSTEALEKGEIDALLLREPELSLALASNTIRVLVDEPIGRFIMSPWPMGFGAVSTRFSLQNPELTKKIVSSWQKAVDFIRKNPEEAGRLLTECAKEKYDAPVAIRPLSHWSLNEIDKSVLQKQIDLYYEVKHISNHIKVDDITLK